MVQSSTTSIETVVEYIRSVVIDGIMIAETKRIHFDETKQANNWVRDITAFDRGQVIREIHIKLVKE